MTKQHFWQLFCRSEGQELSLEEELNLTSFDELMEIDLQTGHFRIVTHVDEKYYGVAREGNFRRLYFYAADNFVHPEDREAFHALLAPDTLAERLRDAETPGVLMGEFRVKGIDGSWIWTKHLLIAGQELNHPASQVCCYVYDIRQQKERSGGADVIRQRQTVRREEVTGLPEGLDFFRPIQDKLSGLTDGWCIVDILIDHYKHYTDWFGLESGRYLLSQTGGILRDYADSTGGMAGYLGQEEFCLVVPYDRVKFQGLYDSLQSRITAVSRMDGFSPLFGIARLDGSSSQILEYFNHASLAAENLQGSFQKRISLYDDQMHRRNSDEYRILCDFQNSLNCGEISFVLQPQVRVSNGKIVGAEALARWQHRDGSLTVPGLFVPILEKYGLITHLDLFIWEEVCRWQHEMMLRGRDLIPISVNVSQMDILEMDVPEHFAALTEKYGLPVGCVKVEITESAYADDLGRVRDTMTRLQKLGFTVLMDDFGSGYSSLNMLQKLNVDIIKLDAQFLQSSESAAQNGSRKGVNILESVVNMTKNLSIPIIVEGIETAAQAEFLEGLGCRYMQGFYFYRPMPPDDFEELIADSSRIDTNGFRFKANQQLTVREFMDENVFTDTMLNNVLGAVAFYRWDGKENTDIIRFNEQFYEMVGIDPEEFERRKNHIQDYFFPADRKVFTGLLAEAEKHWAIGSKGTVRVFRPNGAIIWLSLKLFFMNTDSRGKVFYASAHDITETQVINTEMPGAYYRCSLSDDFEFFFISRNFQKMTGYSEREIRVLFDNQLIRMVHPADVELLRRQSARIARGETESSQPYRIRRKAGDYIYVAEHSQVSDRFGALCWQAMIVDVSEVMKLRNQMRILSDYLSSSVLFLHRRDRDLFYEVAIHGLAEAIGMDASELQTSLNSGDFCKMIEGYREGIPHQEYTKLFISESVGRQRVIRVRLKDGRCVSLTAAVDRVEDKQARIEYIIVLRAAEQNRNEAQG
ncbi:MAG: EAL domain-containing protein [Oscillospiraceae bacterium]|nr:EAL domain-containing protein [Oscillospiraceae bacterium]